MTRLPVPLLLLLLCAGCLSVSTPPPPAPPPAPPQPSPAELARAAAASETAKRDPAQPLPDGLYAEITTPRGTITAELHFEKIPLTVASFVGLAEGALGPLPRKPYFDGVVFHRVVPAFVIQGGDPTGTGRGDPGYKFPDEFAAGLRHDGPGILSMANSGPDTNGSQFFITLGAARRLDFNYSIFGRVIRGGDVPARVERGDSMTVKIIRRGAAAEAFRTDEASFQQLLTRASRHSPPHLEDKTNFGSATPAPGAKVLESRLANLARFTGRRIYVRLFDSIPAGTAESAGQTAQQFVAAQAARLGLTAEAILACYFADEDRWLTAGGPPDLKIPTATPLPPPIDTATSSDAVRQARQRQIYAAANEFVFSLIDQTDPK